MQTSHANSVVEERARRLMTEAGALLADSHVVLHSWSHSKVYIDKDALYADPERTYDLCQNIVTHFLHSTKDITVVAAPEKGGIALSQWCAYFLSLCFRHKQSYRFPSHYQGPERAFALFAEKENGRFLFRHGYAKLILGRKVLVVDDVVTTGASVREVVHLVREHGGEVIGVGALWNRGGVTAEDAGEVPELHALVEEHLEEWEEEECPLCRAGVPVNIEFGRGLEFLAKKRSKTSS